MIDKYSFGHITINQQPYSHDVQVVPGEVMPWQRAESHYFTFQELKEVIDRGVIDKQWPDYIVIGNGHDGVLRVDPEIAQRLPEKGVELIVKKTDEAKDEYNKLEKRGENVLGLFHLTC